jgi:hypothetical protein
VTPERLAEIRDIYVDDGPIAGDDHGAAVVEELLAALDAANAKNAELTEQRDEANAYGRSAPRPHREGAIVTPERLDELHQTHERYALNHEEITELFGALDAANTALRADDAYQYGYQAGHKRAVTERAQPAEAALDAANAEKAELERLLHVQEEAFDADTKLAVAALDAANADAVRLAERLDGVRHTDRSWEDVDALAAHRARIEAQP